MDRGAWGDYSPWGLKELDTTEQLSTHARTLFLRQALDWNNQLLGFGVSFNLSPEQQGLCPQARRSSWGCLWGSSWFLLEPGDRRGGALPKRPFPLGAALQGWACPQQTSSCKNPCLRPVSSPSLVLKQGVCVCVCGCVCVCVCVCWGGGGYGDGITTYLSSLTGLL